MDLFSVFCETADGWRAGFETENQAIASNDLFLLQSVGTQKWHSLLIQPSEPGCNAPMMFINLAVHMIFKSVLYLQLLEICRFRQSDRTHTRVGVRG